MRRPNRPRLGLPAARRRGRDRRRTRLLGDIPALTEVLLYHVVAGNAKAADVVALDSVTTVQGDAVAITVEGGTVLLNDARILIADIEAANGTIHVIDSVLIPPEDS